MKEVDEDCELEELHGLAHLKASDEELNTLMA